VKIGKITEKFTGVTNAVITASAAALLLYLARSVATGNAQFSFMAWNLILSLLALAAAVAFYFFWHQSKKYLTAVAFIVWLFLLPNTFYMLTDFVHVKESGDINLLFDIVLVGLFAMNGFVHGLLSLFIVHKTLLKRYSRAVAHCAVAACILASSFAVDMGRYLRWNSWDVLVNPRALIFDVSDTLLNPTSYQRSFLITAVFFVTIGSLYAVVWQLGNLKNSQKLTK
jgi:uncharacterized membrane protein